MSGEKEQFVVDYLMKKIEGGSYKIGERVPSEYQLARKFNIDKGTATVLVHGKGNQDFQDECKPHTPGDGNGGLGLGREFSGGGQPEKDDTLNQG